MTMTWRDHGAPKIQNLMFFSMLNSFITFCLHLLDDLVRRRISQVSCRGWNAMVIRRGKSEEIEVFSWETSYGGTEIAGKMNGSRHGAWMILIWFL
jgi:hypothetical protein